MIGIYKITNPNGHIYVGQSTEIEKRRNKYSYCEYMYENNKLYNSLRSHGYINHKFEIIEECTEEKLDEREVYWIEYFKSWYKKYPENNGLNLEPGGNKPPKRPLGYKMSDEAKKAISEKAKQRHVAGRYKHVPDKLRKHKPPKEIEIKKVKKEKVKLTKKQVSEIQSKAKIKYYENHSVSDETKQKQSKSFWNNRNREEFSKQCSERFKGRISPMKGKKQTEKHANILKIVQEGLKKEVLQFDLNGNFVREWNGLVEIKKELGFNPDIISLVCRNKYKHTNYKGFIWKFKKCIQD